MDKKILTVAVALAFALTAVAAGVIVSDESDAAEALIPNADTAEAITVKTNTSTTAVFDIKYTGPQTVSDVSNKVEWYSWTGTGASPATLSEKPLKDEDALTPASGTGTVALASSTAITNTIPSAGDSVYSTTFSLTVAGLNNPVINLAVKVTTTVNGNSLDQYYLFAVTIQAGGVITGDLYSQVPGVGSPVQLNSVTYKKGETVKLQLSFNGVTIKDGKYYAEGLPDGLTMGHDGLITGIVANNASTGTVKVTAFDSGRVSYYDTFTFTVGGEIPKVLIEISDFASENATGIATSVDYGGTHIPRYVVKSGNEVTFNAFQTNLPAGSTISIKKVADGAESEITTLDSTNVEGSKKAVAFTPMGAGEVLLKAVIVGENNEASEIYLVSIVVVDPVDFANAGIQFDLTTDQYAAP